MNLPPFDLQCNTPLNQKKTRKFPNENDECLRHLLFVCDYSKWHLTNVWLIYFSYYKFRRQRCWRRSIIWMSLSKGINEFSEKRKIAIDTSESKRKSRIKRAKWRNSKVIGKSHALHIISIVRISCNNFNVRNHFTLSRITNGFSA